MDAERQPITYGDHVSYQARIREQAEEIERLNKSIVRHERLAEAASYLADAVEREHRQGMASLNIREGVAQVRATLAAYRSEQA